MIQLIAEGLSFPESPCWSDRDNRLYFVEWTGDRIWTVREGKAQLLFNTEPGGGPSGLCQDKDGNFWVCLYSNRKLVQYSPEGILLQAFATFREKSFRGPNDITMDSSGEIYFTDGGDYEEDWVSGRPAGALYHLDPGRTLHRLDQGLCFPNGIAASPDGKILYVAEHRKNRVLKYHLATGSQVSHKEVFFILDDQCLLEPDLAYELGPDGMGTDDAGNLWVAHYGGGKVVQINDQGTLLKTIHIPRGRKPTNVKVIPTKGMLYITEAEYGLLYAIGLGE